MKLSKILQINSNLIKLKDKKKEFGFSLGKKLIHNLRVTNNIIEEENQKLTELIKSVGVFDGYEYIINDMELFKSMNDEMYNKDIANIGLLEISIDDLNNGSFDLETIELITNILTPE
jgi:hypothetical protein